MKDQILKNVIKKSYKELTGGESAKKIEDIMYKMKKGDIRRGVGCAEISIISATVRG